MATIPSPSSLSTNLQGSVTPVAPRRGQNAFIGLGRAIADKSQEREDAKRRLALTKAKSAYLTGKAKADASFDHDNDYETWEERYGDVMKGVEGEASRYLDRYPEMKAIFAEEVGADSAIGAINMRDRAFKKEVEVETAAFNEAMAAAQDDLILAKDVATRQAIIESVDEHIDSMGELGYWDAPTVQAHKEKLAAQMMEGVLKSKRPEEQVELLKNDKSFKQLPEGRRKELLIAAENGAVVQTATSRVDAILAENDDRGEAMAEANKIKDGAVRKEVKSQLNYQLNQIEADRAEDQHALKDKFIKRFVEGNGQEPIAKQRIEHQAEWDQLDGAAQLALSAMDQSGVKKTTNRKSYTNFHAILQTEGPLKARTYLYQNSHLWSDTDFKAAFHKTEDTARYDSFLSEGAIIKEQLEIAGIASDAAQMKVQQSYDEARASFYQEKQRYPNSLEAREIVDSLVSESSGGWFGFGSEAFYEMDDAERNKFLLEDLPKQLQYHDEEDQKEWGRRFQQFYKRYGRPPTRSDHQRMIRVLGQ